MFRRSTISMEFQRKNGNAIGVVSRFCGRPSNPRFLHEQKKKKKREDRVCASVFTLYHNRWADKKKIRKREIREKKSQKWRFLLLLITSKIKHHLADTLVNAHYIHFVSSFSGVRIDKTPNNCQIRSLSHLAFKYNFCVCVCVRVRESRGQR